MSAVAMIVSEPPSSILRAAPKNRFGLCSDAVSRPPESVRPELGNDLVVGTRETRDRVEQNHDVFAELDETLGALHRELGDGGVILGMLVERRGDDFAVDRALHVGDFFGTLVDEQRDDVRVGMIDRDRVRDVLEQRRLTGFRRRDDQRALALADRAEEIDDARRELRRANFELKALLRVDRRALFEDAPAFDRFGIEVVDFVDANESVVLFALFRPARLSLDHVAAAQFEAANLRLADVDVVVADVVAGAAQEAVALGQDVENAARHLDARARDLRLHEQSDDLVFLDFRRRGYLDFEFFGDLDQFVLRFLGQLSRGQHRRHFDLRNLIVISRPGVAGSDGGGAYADGVLRRLAGGAYLVEAMLGVGTMFRLQKSISLLESLTSSFDDRGRGEAAIAVRSVT